MLIKKISAFFIFSATMACFMPNFAAAQSNVNNTPPRVLSPDLVNPWVMQLYVNSHDRGAMKRQANYRLKTTERLQDYKKPKTMRQSRSHKKIVSIRNALVSRPEGKNRKPVHNVKRKIDPKFWPQIVPYLTKELPGAIIIDTGRKFLYLVRENGRARRYGIGVGREGFDWKGSVLIRAKGEWPAWHPPKKMRVREKTRGVILPKIVQGGLQNPLGARAMYLYKDGKDTLYRIHGTNQPWTIGRAVSSGCIRMRNEDVIDLYERVTIGTKVTVT